MFLLTFFFYIGCAEQHIGGIKAAVLIHPQSDYLTFYFLV